MSSKVTVYIALTCSGAHRGRGQAFNRTGGRSIRRGDPSFYFREYAAPAGCALDDEAAWKVANPALDDFIHCDALRATLPPKLREAAFRCYPLGQWVTVEDA